MSFAVKMITFRAKNNLNQEQAAKILGVSPAMICRYEKSVSTPSRKNELMFNEIMKNYESENKKGDN